MEIVVTTKAVADSRFKWNVFSIANRAGRGSMFFSTAAIQKSPPKMIRKRVAALDDRDREFACNFRGSVTSSENRNKVRRDR